MSDEREKQQESTQAQETAAPAAPSEQPDDITLQDHDSTASRTEVAADAAPAVDAEEVAPLAQNTNQTENQTDDQTDNQIDDQTDKTDDQTEKARKPGRLLSSLALLLALVGVGGVGYLYYLLVYLEPVAKVSAQQAEVEQTFAQLSADLATRVELVRSESAASVTEMLAGQEQRLAENESRVLQALNEALQAAPPSQNKWKLAEAEYLMRIANHRVLMEQDANGALNLLLAADEVIAQLDDYALHQVRARLADEIVALRQVRRDDLQGLYLRLEAVKSGLDNLLIETPEYLAERPPPAEEQTVWQTLLAELSQFVRVRTLGGGEAIKPLLAPDEEHYLELNLRLALQQAQSAALKRQQAVYESGLQSVRGWVENYMVRDDAAKAVLVELDELLEVELARPLPDVSGSLNELLAANGGRE